MDETEKRIQSLLRLPSLINWVRHNKRRLDHTTFKIREFVANPPRHSLIPVQKICASIAYGEFDAKRAYEEVEKIKLPAARVSGREVIPAFIKYFKASGLTGVAELNSFQAMYIVGKEPNDEPLLVPVKPTFVGARGDKLIPVFVVAWVDFNLDRFQKFLLSTIVCDSVLSQQDFLGSDAEVVAFPRIPRTKTRHQQGWKATQYNLLSHNDLIEQFERYTQALRAVIAEMRAA